MTSPAQLRAARQLANLSQVDLAKATGQDPTMPEGLPEAAYNTIHGRFSDEQRIGVFKPEVPVPPGASFQDRLLAYTGRDPSQ